MKMFFAHLGAKRNQGLALRKHRAEMLEITKSIMNLALARQKLAQNIAKVKGISGLAIEDHIVEERISSEMTKYAESIGVERELASKLVSELIEYSKIAQRRTIFLPKIKSHLRKSGVRIASVIGAGRMGVWFAKYLLEAGIQVILFDQNARLAEIKAKEIGCKFTSSFMLVAKSDLIIAAVPISSTRPLIRRLAKEIAISGKSARIVEISSVKSSLGDLQSGLSRNTRLYSVHPLFGTLANRFAENSLVVVSDSPLSIDYSRFVERLFPHFRIFTMSVIDHDKLMADLLTVPHLHALGFGDQEASKQNRPKNIRSPSFDYMYELSRRTLSENGKVYYEIQATNPFAKRAMDDSITSMKKIRTLLRNEKAFRKFFKEAQRAI